MLLSGILFFFGFIFFQYKKYEISPLKIETESAPLIDGILDEDVWKIAPSISGFIQFEPDKGAPASLKTVCKLLYDGDHIYFGFVCFDPEPEKIELGNNKRDTLSRGADNISVA